MGKKVVLITGAAKGIGAKTVELFLKEGYSVIVHYYKSKDIAENLKKSLENNCSGDIYLIQGDLTKEEDISRIAEFIKSITNHLDVLINNAALSLDNDIFDKTKEEFIKVLDVNLVAPFFLIKSLVDLLHDGVIVNISSTDGIDTGSVYNIDYSVSKAGLITLTKILANRFEDINIYAIAPNWVKTESVLEMDPEFLENELRRVGQKKMLLPEEVAHKILDMVEDKSLISGSIIRMDGNE